MRRTFVFFIIVLFQVLGYGKALDKINNKSLEELNKSLNITQTESEVVIYGVISSKCACSRASLDAFTEVQKNLKKGSKLVVFDIGPSSEAVFEKIKSSVNLPFELRYDAKKTVAKFFNAKVTPSVFVLKNNKVLYSAAVINPGLDPSPNFLLLALKQIYAQKSVAEHKPFGCMIEI